MTPSRKIRAAAAGAACLGLGAIWLSQSHTPTVSLPGDAAAPRRAAPPTRLEPLRPERPLTVAMDGGPPLQVVMDEICVRGADGMETFVKLDPPATPATFRARLAEFSGQGEVLPVVYPENGERSEMSRGIVTRKLRVRLPDDDAERVAAANQLDISERPEYAPGWTIMSAADPLAAVAAIDGVRASTAVTSADVLVARQRAKRLMPNDTLISDQWHLKNATTSPSITHINVEGVWGYGETTGYYRGTGVSIGIVDDGLQTSHPDLLLNVDTINDKDWNGNDSDPNPSLGSDNHGTACGGVAAARGNNSLGVSGVAPNSILVGMRLVSASTTDQQEAEAMAWKNDGIFVKSNSWGPSDTGNLLEAPGPLTLAAFQNALASGREGKGTIFVWAGGNGRQVNDNSNYDGYANRIETIAVGAIDSTGGQATYSEPGANLLVVAPSGGATGITTSDRTSTAGFNTASGTAGNYHNNFGGTSAATPVVSGVVALILQRNPNLGWRDVQEILLRSATKVQPADPDWQTNGAGFSFNHKFGAGLVNAGAAVGMAATWQNLGEYSKRTVTTTGTHPIPESGSVSRTFTVSSDFRRVEAATVTLTATHSSRGDLAITLTSPSGMTSRLAEVHADANANYNQWTFSTVRHWGESSNGTWTVQVTDAGAINSSGGTLGTVTLDLYGVSSAPANPRPVVLITSPTAGQAFPPGSTVPVTVSATDVTIEGGVGTVSQVELLVDGLPAGTDTVPPFEFSITPADGLHTLVARAIDTEGETGTSPSVAIALQNQPPVIQSATLSASGQAYADTALQVTQVNASDPEASPISFTYQWQSSTDDRNYTNVPGKTAASLPAEAANAGKLWRCLITPSDGVNTGELFETASVNLLTRPPLSAKTGTSFLYDSGLVIRGAEEVISRRMLINEFSQGSDGNRDWLELLVLQSGSIVSWEIGNSVDAIIFKDHALWQNLPAGTLIIIYKGTGTKDTVIPADNVNPAAGPIVVAHNNATYFDIPVSSLFPLTNAGDALTLSDDAGNVIHRVSYGGNTTGSPALAEVNVGQSAKFIGGLDLEANAAGKWSIAAWSAATPGTWNNTTDGQANQDFIIRLRTNNLIEIPPFRISAASDLPANLSLNETTGRLSGTISASLPPKTHTIIIERYNKDGEVVAQTLTLRVFPNSYAQWVTSQPGVQAGVALDDDGDGFRNLVEYALDLDPRQPEATGPVLSVIQEGETISLTYRQSKLPGDVTLVAEWSTSLDASASWQAGGITTTVLEEDALSKLTKASLDIAPGDAKRFLRLKATLTSP